MSALSIESKPKELDRRVRGNFEKQGFMCSIGARITDLEPGYCEISLPFRPSLSQQHGHFHGGVIAALADVAGGYAAFSLLPSDQSNVTVEFKLNYLSTGDGEQLVAEAKVIRSGRNLTISQIDVHSISDDSSEKLCATALATYMAIDNA